VMILHHDILYPKFFNTVEKSLGSSSCEVSPINIGWSHENVAI
jgi:hypothetical protein